MAQRKGEDGMKINMQVPRNGVTILRRQAINYGCICPFVL